MSAPLTGRCIVNNRHTHFSFADWLPQPIPDIVIGINPTASTLSEIFREAKNSVYTFKWLDNELYFLPPRESTVQHMANWQSTSPGSVSLYPWWCTFAPRNGPPVDVICQIHPCGTSSEHEHAPEKDIAIAEEYGPIWNDGHTHLCVEGRGLHPLFDLERIRPNESHQLMRMAPGFSIHLLLMRSWRFRFPCKDGHIPCSRLKTLAALSP